MVTFRWLRSFGASAASTPWSEQPRSWQKAGDLKVADFDMNVWMVVDEVNHSFSNCMFFLNGSMVLDGFFKFQSFSADRWAILIHGWPCIGVFRWSRRRWTMQRPDCERSGMAAMDSMDPKCWGFLLGTAEKLVNLYMWMGQNPGT